jgi:hypothetical protein
MGRRRLAWSHVLVFGVTICVWGHSEGFLPRSYEYTISEAHTEEGRCVEYELVGPVDDLPGWGGIWNELSGTVHRAVGRSIALGEASITESNVEEVARAFIREMRGVFRADDEDLRLLRATSRCGKWFVVFDRYHDGIRVWDARVDLRFTEDGRVFLIGADSYPRIDISTDPGLASDYAVEALIRATNSEHAGAEVKTRELVIFPRGRGRRKEFALAWHVAVWTEDPLAHYESLVDAETGEVLLLYDDVRYETVMGDVRGFVHPEHRADPYIEVPFLYEWIEAVGVGGGWGVTDETGYFEIYVEGPERRLVRAKLWGDFVEVTNAAGSEGLTQDSLVPGSVGELVWDDSTAIASERDGYFHTNVAHSYIKGIDPGFLLLDYPMLCEMNIPGFSNAYWDGSGMHYGAGGNDFGQHADVIYHEYGHGVTDFQYRPRAPSGAMHEGFSDFFAATITDDSRIGEGVMSSRDLDNNMRSPENLTGESHNDGMIIGGALWHMRENLNDVPLAESLFHFARYGYPGSPSQPNPQNFLDYLIEVYVVDDDDADLTNGTPHDYEIAQAFGRHGIGPYMVLDSVDASDVSSGADIFLDPGDTVQVITWVKMLQSLGFDAQNVSGVMSCDDPAVSVVSNSAYFGAVPMVGTGDNAADPFVFVVSDTLTRVVDVPFSVELLTTDMFHATSFDFEVRVGHPEVILVDDDDGAPYEMFFESSLDSIGIKAFHWDVRIRSTPEAAVLGMFPAVIWFTGDARSGTLDDSEMLLLAEYLDGGGRLFLTGQNIGEDIGSESFYTDYLRATYIGPVSDDHILEGVSGDFIGDGLTMITAGSGGGSNQTSQDIIDIISPADTVIMYDDGIGGVKYDSGIFKTVYFSFGLEGVNDFLQGYDHRPIILKRILLWFGLTVGCEEECDFSVPGARGDFNVLQNAPNPFSSSTSISLTLPVDTAPGEIDLIIYDVSGRAVRTLDIPDRKTKKITLTWDGRDESGRALPSGVYFCSLDGSGSTRSRKMIKLM